MKNDNLFLWIKNNYYEQEIKEIVCLRKGFSTNTYKITFLDNKKIVLKKSVDNKPSDSIFIKRQFDTQLSIQKNFLVPKPIIFCSDNEIIGSNFYLMEYFDGKNQYDKNSLNKFFDILIEMHKSGIKNNTNIKKNITKKYIETLYFQYQQNLTQNSPDLKKIFLWLINNIKDQDLQCFIHNDWRMSNVLFNKEKYCILDWELSQLADPRIDLGIAMSYLAENNDNEWKYVSPEPHDKYETFNKKEIIDYYFDNTGFDRKNWKFFECLGIFRLIVIGQIGNFKYKNMIIDSEEFENMDKKIKIAYNRCKEIIGE